MKRFVLFGALLALLAGCQGPQGPAGPQGSSGGTGYTTIKYTGICNDALGHEVYVAISSTLKDRTDINIDVYYQYAGSVQWNPVGFQIDGSKPYYFWTPSDPSLSLEQWGNGDGYLIVITYSN
jgi:hypothetical protein